jgi:cell division septum initiation protein DivIVA
MTPDQQPIQQVPDDRRLTAQDVQAVQFAAAGMLHPGYDGADVEKFRSLVADELTRSAAERADLQARVHALEEQLSAVVPHEAPSDTAVRILSVAQQTADQYVAEAEDFSRQMTSDARSQYEEQLRSARESAGAIIQAAHEAAARMVVSGGAPSADPGADPEQVREEVAYLKAFGQAVRVQLRSYLEALITDVETEWGQASPQAVAQAPVRAPAQRADAGGARAPLNVVAEVPPPGDAEPGAAGPGGVEVSGARR